MDGRPNCKKKAASSNLILVLVPVSMYKPFNLSVMTAKSGGS